MSKKEREAWGLVWCGLLVFSGLCWYALWRVAKRAFCHYAGLCLALVALSTGCASPSKPVAPPAGEPPVTRYIHGVVTNIETGAAMEFPQ